MNKEEYERKKHWLEQYGQVLKECVMLEAKIRECREEQIAISIKYDGMPHGSSSKTDLSDYIAKLDELMSKYLRAKTKAAGIKSDIEERISNIESADQRVLLRLRYMDLIYSPRSNRYYKRSWESICREMGYQEAQIYRIHRKALQRIDVEG